MNEDRLKKAIARKLRVSPDSIKGIRIRKRSIDARHGAVKIQIDAALYINEEPEKLYEETVFPHVDGSKKAIVVGFGPAGIFAALTLLENGICPIVLERGEDVHSRLKSIGTLSREGKLNEESNYAFGEGGAGAACPAWCR